MDQTVRAGGSSRRKVARAKDETIRATRGLVPSYRLNSRVWRRLARDYKAHCKTRKLLCHICRQPIDYTLTTGRWCFEPDHKYPRKTYPHLTFTWSNLLPSHRTCNRSRQAKPYVAQELWIQPTW